MEPGGRRPPPRPLRLLQQFINTHTYDIVYGIARRNEEFTEPGDLHRWLVRHGLLAWHARVHEFEFTRALEVREAFRRVLLAHNGLRANPAVVTTLNRLARDAHLVVRVEPDGKMRLEPRAAGVIGALGWLLAAAYATQVDGTWQRFKACRRCRWTFYDHSKNRSGTWCAMSICGNRAKAEAYRTRHRRRLRVRRRRTAQ